VSSKLLELGLLLAASDDIELQISAALPGVVDGAYGVVDSFAGDETSDRKTAKGAASGAAGQASREAIGRDDPIVSYGHVHDFADVSAETGVSLHQGLPLEQCQIGGGDGAGSLTMQEGVPEVHVEAGSQATVTEQLAVLKDDVGVLDPDSGNGVAKGGLEAPEPERTEDIVDAGVDDVGVPDRLVIRCADAMVIEPVSTKAPVESADGDKPDILADVERFGGLVGEAVIRRVLRCSDDDYTESSIEGIPQKTERLRPVGFDECAFRAIRQERHADADDVHSCQPCAGGFEAVTSHSQVLT